MERFIGDCNCGAQPLSERNLGAGWRKPGAAQDSGRDGLHFAEHFREVIDRVVEEINAPSTNFANSHRLLLSGEAGIGKSHLLADVTASIMLRRAFPPS